MSDATGDLLILMAVVAGMTILYFYAIVAKGVYDNHNPKHNEVGEAHVLNAKYPEANFLFEWLRETRLGMRDSRNLLEIIMIN